jgi:Tfp pilus assembly protein PilF
MTFGFDPFDTPEIRLGLAYAASGSRSEAIAAFRRAQAAAPDAFPPYFLLGVAACEDAQWEEAFHHCLAVIDRAPALPEPYNNLGVVYWHQGDFSGAQTCWEKALSLNGHHQSAMLNLGLAFLKDGRHLEAQTCMEKAVSIGPMTGSALNNLGVIYFHGGQFVEAEECFGKAVGLDGDLAAPLRNLAHIYACKGQDTEAQHCHNRAAVVRKSASYLIHPFHLIVHLARRIGGPDAADPYERPDAEVTVYDLDEEEG